MKPPIGMLATNEEKIAKTITRILECKKMERDKILNKHISNLRRHYIQSDDKYRWLVMNFENLIKGFSCKEQTLTTLTNVFVAFEIISTVAEEDYNQDLQRELYIMASAFVIDKYRITIEEANGWEAFYEYENIVSKKTSKSFDSLTFIILTSFVLMSLFYY